LKCRRFACKCSEKAEASLRVTEIRVTEIRANKFSPHDDIFAGEMPADLRNAKKGEL